MYHHWPRTTAQPATFSTVLQANSPIGASAGVKAPLPRTPARLSQPACVESRRSGGIDRCSNYSVPTMYLVYCVYSVERARKGLVSRYFMSESEPIDTRPSHLSITSSTVMTWAAMTGRYPPSRCFSAWPAELKIPQRRFWIDRWV